MHFDSRCGERCRGFRQEAFGDVFVDEEFFGGVAYADALGFGVDEDGDGFVGVAGAVDVNVHVAGSGFDDGDFGVAYHGLDESCSPAWDEHVDVATCFHHGGGAVASVLVYGGDHVVVVSVFGEYVGDDGECCRVGVFGRVSAAQQDGVAGFDA